MNKLIVPVAAMLMATTPASAAVGDGDAMTGYVFAYFEGRGARPLQEHLRFAVSDDAVNWKALNRNFPIIASDTISESKGIRDPHILRGADGKSFYMVATDMNTTRHGWGANPGIVMMKSDNLTDWSHASVNLAKAFPKKFGDAFWVWAPQVIYDPDVKKYMIYFTLVRKERGNKMITYYAYANKDFTGLESEPKKLFEAKDGCLDNDIVKGPDGLYYMYFKGNTKNKEGKETKNGIKYATAKHLRGPWKEHFDYVDAYAGKTPVEGSGVFRLNDSDEYVLMYDMYTSGKYEYQTSKDLRDFSKETKSFNKDFFPRHGTVMPVTAAEMKRLKEKWGDGGSAVKPRWRNPVLPGWHADPEVLYSNKTGKYYIYSTTDGVPGWGGSYFTVFQSPDMDEWTDAGVALDLKGDQVKWATGNAWAPAIIERKEGKGYKYYLYFSGHNPQLRRKTIGVAVANDPAGPFTDLGYPIVTDSPAGRGQQIDVDVFQDPVSKKYYLYWGNGYMAGAELNDDMTSIKEETITVMTPKGGSLATYAFREAPYVFYRDGKYYFMWSVDDTGSPNYHVSYGTSDSPLGPIKVADPCTILVQRPEERIYGTAHNSVIQLPGTDEWRIVYHRINEDYIEKKKGPGFHREVCIDVLEFNPDGSIRPVTPTNK